jgi:hypothetical protein
MGLFKSKLSVSKCEHGICCPEYKVYYPKNKLFYPEMESSEVSQQTTSPNPDPKNFKIIKMESVGRFQILKINYPDCTNFEGNKILIYENRSMKELANLSFIDPHFCDSEHISPIARFEPTEKGWAMAITFCNALD